MKNLQFQIGAITAPEEEIKGVRRFPNQIIQDALRYDYLQSPQAKSILNRMLERKSISQWRKLNGGI